MYTALPHTSSYFKIGAVFVVPLDGCLLIHVQKPHACHGSEQLCRVHTVFHCSPQA